ncbi:MAG: hypothetical protein ACJAVI_004439 [Candidatus Azotimanducaceae bacterium]|jgi:hypothetical protein
MGHMEAITQSLLRMALAFGGAVCALVTKRICNLVLDWTHRCLDVYATSDG